MQRSFVTAGLLVVGVALVGYVLILAVLVLRQDRLLFFPSRVLASGPEAFGLRAEPLSIRTADGLSLHGWWIKGNGRKALLYFHGNAGNAADRLARARILNERFGLDVFLVDYRGYGRSEGSPSEDGLYRDGRAICQEAIRSGFGADRIVLFGESLGSAVAIQLASERKCAALIVETPFSRFRPCACILVPSFVKNRFDNAQIGSSKSRPWRSRRARRGRAPELWPRTLRPRPQQENARGHRGRAPQRCLRGGGESYGQAWDDFWRDSTSRARAREGYETGA
jgi:pimeloyl-ACP methyl ester carboxylesterase